MILDEVDLTDMHPDDVKNFFDMEEDRSVKIRWENVAIPAGTPKLCASNAGDFEKEFLPRPRKTHDMYGMKRRILDVHILTTLIKSERRPEHPALSDRPMPAFPPQPAPSVRGDNPNPACPPPAPRPAAGEANWDRLKMIMEWKTQGLLTEDEFAQAKHKYL